MNDLSPTPSHAIPDPALDRRRRRAAMSIRLRVDEYDALCRRAIREERTVSCLIRVAVLRLLKMPTDNDH